MVKVSAAFVIHNHQILLFHRDNKPDIGNPDKWCLIGGHAEGDETPDEALLRETQEEICVTPSSFQFLTQVTDYVNAQVSMYKILLTDQEAAQVKLGNEGQEVKFFDWAGFEELASEDKLSKDLYLFHQVKPNFIKPLLKSEES